MPPNAPTGWQLPPWLQIVLVIAVVVTPFSNAFFAHIKDRRGQNLQRDQGLVDDQQSYIDKLLAAAAKVPELLEKLEQALNANLDLKGQIQELKGEVRELTARVKHLEEERDLWRRQAERVPQLEGQVQTLTNLLEAKHAELLAAQVKLKQLEGGC